MYVKNLWRMDVHFEVRKNSMEIWQLAYNIIEYVCVCEK